MITNRFTTIISTLIVYVIVTICLIYKKITDIEYKEIFIELYEKHKEM